MKSLHWVFYIASQLLLLFIVIWIGIRTEVSEHNQFFIGFMIATYGFLLVLSGEIKRKYNGK